MSEFHSYPEPPKQTSNGDLSDYPMKPSLIRGGAVAFVLTLWPITLTICCLPLIIAALVGVHDYTRRYSLSLTIAQGMKVGILSCMVGYGAAIAVYDALWALFDYQIGMEAYRQMMAALLEEAPPELKEKLAGMSEGVGEEPFSMVFVVGDIFRLILASAIGGAIGGLIGSALFKRKEA